MNRGYTFWQQVRTAYEQEKLNYTELAKRFGVAIGSISYHANREGWKREDELPGVSECRIRETARKLSKVAAREAERLEEQETDMKTLRELATLVKELGQIMKTIQPEQQQETGLCVQWDRDAEEWSQ